MIEYNFVQIGLLLGELCLQSVSEKILWDSAIFFYSHSHATCCGLIYSYCVYRLQLMWQVFSPTDRWTDGQTRINHVKAPSTKVLQVYKERVRGTCSTLSHIHKRRGFAGAPQDVISSAFVYHRHSLDTRYTNTQTRKTTQQTTHSTVTKMADQTTWKHTQVHHAQTAIRMEPIYP